jgi:anaerobic selenocysteine-containing dehydrogenase
VFGRRDVVFMSAADLVEQGLAHGDLIWLEPAVTGGASRGLHLTVVSHDIARGSLAAYYPEANALVPLGYGDEQSGTPSYKSVPVRIRKAA